MRKAFRWIGLALVALAGTAMGLAGAALGTNAGRDVLVRTALGIANDAVRGTVTIESYDGSLFGGLELRGIQVADENGVPILEVDQLEVHYRLGDFLSRRIVLGQVVLTRPQVTLIRPEGRRWNVEELVESTGGGGPNPLVAFRDVVIVDGYVSIRQGDRVREIEIPDLAAAYVRLASPFPRESGVHIELTRLRARISDPALDIIDAGGRIDIHGDSLALDLDTFRLPNTLSPLRGFLRTSGKLTFDLAFEPERFVGADIRGLVPVLPAGVAGTGTARVAVDREGVLRFEGDDLDLVTADGGRLAGRLGFTVGPGNAWRADAVNVMTQALDLDYIRPFIDTIPFVGRVTGRTAADGPNGRLDIQLDWRFSDVRADSAETLITGAGIVALGVPGDEAVFEDFRIDTASIAMATVKVLVPAVALRGTVMATGTLNGPWKNAEFAGDLWHVDGSLPMSAAHGSLRFDGQGDVTGIFSDLSFDSLQVDGIRPSYPTAALAGAYAGRVTTDGYLDALAVAADLSGPAGALRGGGTVVLRSPRLGIRNLDLNFSNFTLHALRGRFPNTRTWGRATGDLEVDSLVHPVVDLEVTLDRSRFSGVAIDSARVRLAARDSQLVVDTLAFWGPGGTIAGSGAVSLAAPQSDSIVFEVAVDSLAEIMPLAMRLAGRNPARLSGDSLAGTAYGKVLVYGALDSLALSAVGEAQRVRWNRVRAPTIDASALLGIRNRRLAIDVSVDTLIVGVLGFSGIEGTIDGTTDTFSWFSRARLGPEGSFLAGGQVSRSDSTLGVRLDSLAVLLVQDVWFLGDAGSVTVNDSAVTISNMLFTTASGGGRVGLGGVIPLRGPGSLSATMEGLQLDNLWALAQLDTDRASGELNGRLDLGGTARAPIIDAAIGLRAARFDEFNAPQTEGELHYRDRRLGGTVTLWEGGGEILKVDVSLPLDLAIRDAGRRQLPGPLTVRANAAGVDLAFVSAVYPLVRRTSGRFWADLGIAGTWDGPELTGFLRIEAGATSLPNLGLRLERINGALSLYGDTIGVDSLSVRSGGGTAQLMGFVRLAGLTRPELHLGVRARQFRAINVPDFLSLTTSGQIELTGPVFGSVLTGSGTVTRGVIYFADIIEKEIVSLEDSLLDSATVALIRRQGLGTAFQNRFLDSLRIDSLRLRMGSDVRLRSGEAEILLAGDVTVGKILDQYRIDGVLQTPRGTYSLPLGPTLTKEFAVTRGEVRYFGTPDLNAALDIDARHQVRSVRGDIVSVFVHVGGTINAPALTLSSDVQPPLASTEIISYLVFGAPSAQAAGGALGQYGVEQSIANIAGRITGQIGSSLISDLGIPLDYFEIRPNLTGGLGTEVVVGQQIGDRLFVTLNQRFCPNQAFSFDNVGLSLELRMSRLWRLSLGAEPLVSCFTSITQQTARQLGVDVLWERSY